jgi:septum site-determining protein MinC
LTRLDDQLAHQETQHPNVQMKGIRDGILVTLGEGTWPEIRAAFLEQVTSQADFLKGARLAVDVGNHILRAAELGHLRDILSEHGMTLWAILSSSPTTESTAQTLGLATRINRPRPERFVSTLETTIQDGEQALLVRRTLRSGYRLQYSGHVIVVGDVNPGAEIIAGGDVIVWGRLKGVVHAGAGGNDQAIVCALDLSPTQLRIAGQIATTPQRRGKSQPEMAQIKNDQVTAIAWNPKK